MLLNFPITLVIPILNEVESLPELLSAIKTQSHLPDEIIFSDAGSTDGSRTLIEDWWRDESWAGAVCHVFSLPGAMPGAGRNAGISVARNDWIAFIDAGITPANNWLENLCRYVQLNDVAAVFGICHFSGRSSFTKAVCALTYGQGSLAPVIPASLFSRSVFNEIGDFPAELRAGEDLVWIARFKSRYSRCNVCTDAVVSYTYFNETFAQVWEKWRLAERSCVLAGVRKIQQIVYMVSLLSLFALFFFDWQAGGFAVLAFFLLRGAIDPVRRSLDKPWWGRNRSALFLAPLVAITIDAAKCVGIVQGVGIELWKRIGRQGAKHASS